MHSTRTPILASAILQLVDVGAVCEEELDAVRVAPARGCHERRVAGLAAAVDGRAALEEDAHLCTKIL